MSQPPQWFKTSFQLFLVTFGAVAFVILMVNISMNRPKYISIITVNGIEYQSEGGIATDAITGNISFTDTNGVYHIVRECSVRKVKQ